ncbi:ATP-binding cassette domain-containing protein [Streptomyces zaomyceticus]|uniref:ATP-binding cassette domain-containing protein n=1 Tax=Streptomyces zaomyceticus TaxID=68286 RepID=UPI00342E3B56
MAAGLLRPAGGLARVRGEDATRDAAVTRARRGVRLAPEGRGILAGLTIEENLALQLTAAEDRDAVYARFPALAARRAVAAGSLSGGEQQLLALAPLLQWPPAVLVADEPFLALAPRVVDEVFRLLTELRGHGTALVLVERCAAAGSGSPPCSTTAGSTHSPTRTREPCPSVRPAWSSRPARSPIRPGSCSWTSPRPGRPPGNAADSPPPYAARPRRRTARCCSSSTTWPS